jgi:lambda family phage portal protein
MADFLGDNLSADAALIGDLSSLRARGRALERENPYMVRWLAELEANVLGENGIRMTPDVRTKNGKKPDQRAGRMIADFWREFSEARNFSANRKLDRLQFSRITLRSIARDGDCLVAIIRGFRKNRFGVALQGYEADHIDHQHSDQRGQGAQIRMGVEIDQYGEPIAYHVRSDHPGELYQAEQSRRAYRLAAETARDMQGGMSNTGILPFVQNRFGQDRGAPWASVAIRGLRQLGMYEEALLVAKRISAAKMGFITKTGDREYTGNDQDDDAAKRYKVEPGVIEELDEGQGFQQFDPKEDSQYVDFRKGILRGIAAGLLCNYNILGNDLEGVNYSSIRQGILSERELWKMIQAWYISTVEAPIFRAALEMAILTGEVPLSIAEFDRWAAVRFEGRRWEWVDPLKDVQAARDKIARRLSSRQKEARDQGGDLRKILEENAEDEAMAAELGIKLTVEAEAKNPAPEKPMAEGDESPENNADE